MERSGFLAATRQLAAAAEILARAGPRDGRSDAFQVPAFFRRFERLDESGLCGAGRPPEPHGAF